MSEYLQDTSDEKLAELTDDLYELYVNPEIVNYTHNGKTIPFKYQTLISRPIPGIFSNIEKKPSIHTILTNAIRLSLNLSTHTKNTNELKIYRESCERFKTSLSLLMRKKQQGIQVDDNDIETKTREIKMLEEKINEIATAATFKPEINKKILTNAVIIYNVMLRNDRIPKMLFIRFCKKIGYRFNYSDRFVDEYEKPNSINDMQTRQRHGAYVPPAFRSDTPNNKFTKINKSDSESDNESEIQNTKKLNKLNKNNVECDIPIYQPNTNKNIGVWATKSKLIFKDEDKIDNNGNEVNINTEQINVNTEQMTEIKLSNEWEVNDDF
jgi:hypothetical protein